MMYQEKSGKGRCLKALALAPALAIAIAATSIPQLRAAMSTISDSPVSAGTVTVEPLPVNPTSEESETTTVTTNVTTTGQKTTVIFTTTREGKTEKFEIVLDPALIVDNMAYFVNGKQVSKAELEAIAPDDIKMMSVSKDDKLNVIFVWKN